MEACLRAQLHQHGGAAGRQDGFQEMLAGEKTRGEKETNVNNKPGDGGKPKHTEIARTQEMKSSRRPWGRGLARGACPQGATFYSNEAKTMQPLTQTYQLIGPLGGGCIF